MITNVVLKLSDYESIIKVVKPLTEKYKIKIIGIKWGEKQYLKDEECEFVINVEDYKEYGDETKTFFKNMDQMIYLQGDHEDRLSALEYKNFKSGKIHYDLNKTDFTKPVAHENML